MTWSIEKSQNQKETHITDGQVFVADDSALMDVYFRNTDLVENLS